jgi:branched-chain amino acid aminotransferase
VRVTVSNWVKFHQKMMPTTAKACGQYVNSILAAREAAQRGFDEALLLNADGTIAEGAVENIFLVKNGVLLTNDRASNILLGITRDSVLELAGDLGIPAEIRVLTLEDLRSADEAFFTGTAVEISPIQEVDGLWAGTGVSGPVTARLREAFRNAVTGKIPERRDWLTRVPQSAAASLRK